jgi:hypothetical protein
MGIILLFESSEIFVETVAVFHHKFPHPEQTAPWAGVIPPLCLKLEYEPGQLFVRGNLILKHVGNRFFVCHRKNHVPVIAILKSPHFTVDTEPTACFFPDFRGVDYGHSDFKAAYLFHFLTDDLLNFL